MLTVLLYQGPENIMARGIVEDKDIFEHVAFASLHEALRYLTRYNVTHNVVVNIPPEVKRT